MNFLKKNKNKIIYRSPSICDWLESNLRRLARTKNKMSRRKTREGKDAGRFTHHIPSDLIIACFALQTEDEEDMEITVSEDVEVLSTFDSMGLREDLLRGIYAYGTCCYGL